MLLGGAIGALVGLTATFVGARVLRSDRPPAVRFGLAVAVSVLAIVGYLIVAGVIGLLLQPE